MTEASAPPLVDGIQGRQIHTQSGNTRLGASGRWGGTFEFVFVNYCPFVNPERMKGGKCHVILSKLCHDENTLGVNAPSCEYG
jgi:hypothetical protein